MLQRTASDNKAAYREAARSFQEFFYVEDYLESSERTEKTKRKSLNFAPLLRLGGFNLTKFVSNLLENVAEQNKNPKAVM